MKIEHLGIATRAIDEALEFWRDALGLEVLETEEVAEQKVRVAMLPLGENLLETLHRLGLEPVHRAFDHAMDAAQIAAKLHRHGDVVAMVEKLQNGLRSQASPLYSKP